jgi:small-conductance mechanosensitive channel
MSYRLTAPYTFGSPCSGIFTALMLCITLILLGTPGAAAQQAGADAADAQTAAVIIDGESLFQLRGVTSFPAKKRAEEVRARIIELARDETFTLDDLSISDDQDYSSILVGERIIVRVFDVDAELENLQRPLITQVYLARIKQAIAKFRTDRSAPVLMQRALYALGATALLLALLWGVRRMFRWLLKWSEENVQQSVEQLASKSHQLIQAGPIWTLISGLFRLLRAAVYLLLAYFYLNSVLGFFPWSRPVAKVLFRLIVDPLASLWLGFLNALPSLAFLVVLWIVIRYLLKLIRAFFRGVGRGRIKLEGFDPDWATPTYKIVRVIVIAFALVIAYPYIPGSDSAAFKGVTVFAGVLLSLGSSSFIANSIAGLSMTYRAAFREGDRIKVGDVVGTVEEIKLMVTKVRTPKNEQVVIPNSSILNDNVTNYSHMARRGGVILHTVVSIGYDTPWRQVEALLLLATERTEGLLKEPPPFVLQQSLGDFAVNYELNAHCKDEHRMPALYSALHANIQDVFNEHGVQIMSPAYEADPAGPKIVPPEKWYEAPAKKPG